LPISPFRRLTGEFRLISKESLEGIKRLIFLRNLISHEYYQITENELKEMAGLLNSFNELIENAKGEGRKKL